MFFPDTSPPATNKQQQNVLHPGASERLHNVCDKKKLIYHDRGRKKMEEETGGRGGEAGVQRGETEGRVKGGGRGGTAR